MAAGPRYLIDTNILLRLSRFDDSQHSLIQEALEQLDAQGCESCFSLQNMAEFWNVCTRPVGRNGFGLSNAETNERVEYVERTMTFLPDSEQVYLIWRGLVVSNNVRGVQVHDARLVATMQAHGIRHILTLNQPDFGPYTNICAVHPSQLSFDGTG